MLKNLMHMMVLLVFVVSTIPGIAVATPVMSHKAMEQSDIQHKQYHDSVDMNADHSCNKDKQTADNQNKGEHENCCDADFQCMGSGCAKTQSLHHALAPAFTTALSKKLLFIISNEHHEDSITYLLKRPPKA